jgi:hypothetical protein
MKQTDCRIECVCATVLHGCTVTSSHHEGGEKLQTDVYNQILRLSLEAQVYMYMDGRVCVIGIREYAACISLEEPSSSPFKKIHQKRQLARHKRAQKKIFVYTYNVNNILKIEMVEKEKRIVCFVGKSSNRICWC